MPKSIIKSKICTLNVLIVIIGVSLAALGLVYLISQGIHRRFDLVAFAFELALALFIIYAIREILFIDTVHIYEDSISIKRTWNKTPLTLQKADIGSYYESNGLILFTANGSVKLNLNKTYISNYSEVKKIITQNLMEEHGYKDRKFIPLIILGFIASISLLGAYSNFQNYRKEIATEPLETVKGRLKDKHIETRSYKDIHKYFSLSLTHLPDLRFHLQDLENLNWQSFNQDVKELDSITLFINQEDYETKIAKTKEISFIESSVNYSIVKLYGIQKNNKWYYIYKVEADYKSNDNFQYSIFFLFIGILFVYLFISVFCHRDEAWVFRFNKKGKKRKKLN